MFKDCNEYVYFNIKCNRYEEILLPFFQVLNVFFPLSEKEVASCENVINYVDYVDGCKFRAIMTSNLSILFCRLAL